MQTDIIIIIIIIIIIRRRTVSNIIIIIITIFIDLWDSLRASRQIKSEPVGGSAIQTKFWR